MPYVTNGQKRTCRIFNGVKYGCFAAWVLFPNAASNNVGFSGALRVQSQLPPSHTHQWFLTWLSVLPGSRFAISAQRLPSSRCASLMMYPSSVDHSHFLTVGSTNQGELRFAAEDTRKQQRSIVKWSVLEHGDNQKTQRTSYTRQNAQCLLLWGAIVAGVFFVPTSFSVRKTAFPSSMQPPVREAMMALYNYCQLL